MITPSSYYRCDLFAECVHSQPRDNDDYVLELVTRLGITTDDFTYLDSRPNEVWVKDQSYLTTKWYRRLGRVRGKRESELFKRLSANDQGVKQGGQSD